MKKSGFSILTLVFCAAFIVAVVGCPQKSEPTSNGTTTTDESGSEPQTPQSVTYTFTDTVIPLSGYDGTAGSSKNYVLFGDWPQSVLPKGSTVTIDESESLSVALFTYYAGSDGNWYVKQAEKGYGYVDAGRYSDGSSVKTSSENSTRYFKVEPIKWRVLEEKDGKKFLLAENCLNAGTYYDSYDLDRKINDMDVWPNNYMHSRIRAWLNGYNYQKKTENCTDYQNNGFLQTAFTSNARAKIAVTTVDNSLGSSPYGCENTDDKLFLLSYTEVRTESYGFSTSWSADNTRIRKPTDFALATGTFAYGTSLGSEWCLRTPSDDIYINYVYYNGAIDGDDYYSVTMAHGIVPALWVE